MKIVMFLDRLMDHIMVALATASVVTCVLIVALALIELL